MKENNPFTSSTLWLIKHMIFEKYFSHTPLYMVTTPKLHCVADPVPDSGCILFDLPENLMRWDYGSLSRDILREAPGG